MTSYEPNYQEIKKERAEKKAAGYILLADGGSLLGRPDYRDRMQTIVEEAVAAGLIYIREHLIASLEDRGTTELGEKYFSLSDRWADGPWVEFYVKPNVVDELIAFLDSDAAAQKARNASLVRLKKQWKVLNS